MLENETQLTLVDRYTIVADNEHRAMLEGTGFDLVASRSNLGFEGTVRGNNPPLVTVPQRTEALVNGLMVVLQHHKVPKTIMTDFLNQVSRYLDINSSEEMWLKSAKHFLTYPLARYLRNEAPKTTGNDFQPVGNLKKWMNVRLMCFNRRNTHLWYSWFQAKRAALPASDDFVQTTYGDHLKALVALDDGDESVINEIMDEPTLQLVLKRVAGRVRRMLDDFDERQPSTNACFELTRGFGGQQAELMKCVGIATDVIYESELISMDYRPRYGESGNSVFETRERFGRDRWGNLRGLKELLPLSLSGKPIACTIQAVLEPMKVRVISKGEALPYYLMRPMQKAMHGALRDIPCFRLIGRPFCPTDMIDLKAKASNTDEWFSVDYSAATDGLSWKYSSRLLASCIEELPRVEREIAMSVLGPHRLHYPNVGRPGVTFKGVMQRGQLMGSILSFPILCLANLGVYLLANKDRFKSWSCDEILNHVLVNGDDMLYAAPSCLWDEHIRIGKAVGLNMSIGKSYHHSVYANVNSTSVHYDLKKKDTPHQIDFLNTGLFFGQRKVQGGSETASNHHDDGLSEGKIPIIPQLLKGSLPGRQDELMKLYLSKHKAEIFKESQFKCDTGTVSVFPFRTATRNLFLPISIGGFGIVAPRGFKFEVTSRQKQLAARLRGDCLLETNTMRPFALPYESFRTSIGHSHSVTEMIYEWRPAYEAETHLEILSSPWAIKGVLSLMFESRLKGVEIPTKRWWKTLKLGFFPLARSDHVLI